MERELTEIQQAINLMLNVKSLVRRKKKKQADKKRELFVSIINSIETVSNRQSLMYADLQLDFTKYDESYLEIIDALILLHFGKDGTELIGWYLWERLNPDGSLNYLLDENDDPFTIEDANQLWDILVALNKPADE
jgi:hypothetical protein